MSIRKEHGPAEVEYFIAEWPTRTYRVIVPKGAWPRRSSISAAQFIAGVAGVPVARGMY